MTLEELSAQYRQAGDLLRGRLAELRAMEAEADDPEKKWHLHRRIQELTPMLTQMNDLAWMLEHYYERGGSDHDPRYGFTGKRAAKRFKQRKDTDTPKDIAWRINRLSKRNVHGVLLREEDHAADRRGAGHKQKHCVPYTETGRDKNSPDYKVPDQLMEDLLDKFFGL